MVDISMDRAQWGRFTDFGVTLFDSAGRQIEKQPLNYASAGSRRRCPRVTATCRWSSGSFPASPIPASDEPWTLRAAIRLYADSAVALDARQVQRRHRHRRSRPECLRGLSACRRAPGHWETDSFRSASWWLAPRSTPGPGKAAFRCPNPPSRCDDCARVVRVAAGQGFWGDWLEAPVRQVRGGPIDYLMMDYLAEVTMSIMQKQKSRDPKAGYARDFVPLMERILPDIVEKGIKVTSNAGGVNPRGCAEAVLEVARRLGLVGQAQGGPGDGRRSARPAGRADRGGPSAQQHGDRPAAGRHPRTRCSPPTRTWAWVRSSRRYAAAPTW